MRSLVVDAAFVLLFVIIGRRSHDEANAVVGIATTAWPFLAGLGIGWVAVRAWRHPVRVVPEGLTVWGVTVGVGMVLRVLSGQGTAVSFVVVALIVLAVFLLGWRAVIARVGARTRA